PLSTQPAIFISSLLRGTPPPCPGDDPLRPISTRGLAPRSGFRDRPGCNVSPPGNLVDVNPKADFPNLSLSPTLYCGFRNEAFAPSRRYGAFVLAAGPGFRPG